MTQANVGLTRYQFEILKRVARGMQQAAIAKELNLAEDTVRKYRSQMLRVLNAQNSAHAVAIAYERGWLRNETRQAA